VQKYELAQPCSKKQFNQTQPTGMSSASLGPGLETLLGNSLVWCGPVIIRLTVGLDDLRGLFQPL